MLDDPRRLEAKQIPITEVIDRLGIANLRAQGCEMVGPCPLCGGRDRFGINLRTNAFLCRKCGIKGGDQISLVEEVQGVDFRAALQWLCGDAPAEIDEARLAKRREAARRAQQKQEAEAERFRQQAINEAKAIWRRAIYIPDGLVRAYLSARGIDPEALPHIPKVLRFLPKHLYSRRVSGARVSFEGPAMIAIIQRPDGSGGAVHQTWIDPTRKGGKARILHEGEPQPVKLVRGTKKGGAIRLITPPEADTLVMGEGIETTLTAAAANAVPGAAYWASVDLGNMAGRMAREPGKRHSGIPDMADGDAFVPPPWVRRFILIQDGDSDAKATRAKLLSGARRAMALRPGLQAQIVHAGEGVDLNDLL